MKKLIVVESPTKARTLLGFLDSNYEIIASMGHIRDLPKKKLGIDIDNNFEPQYAIVPGKRKQLKKIKQAASNASEVILATDLDREGEAIAWHISHLLKKDKLNNISRIVFHEITKSALLKALQNSGKLNKQLFHAQQARRLLDRLVGYKLSPVLWKKIRRGLSAGRVQSPALRLIVEREREIKNFKTQEYWEISVKLKTSKKEVCLAQLKKIKDKKAEIKNKKQADEILKHLKKEEYKVLEVRKRQVGKNPPPPFITSTLQRTASSFLKWSAKKTMREAQRLYEHGFITYHRTDSVGLSAQALKMARDYIKTEFGDKFLPEKPRRYRVKSKLAQEAHEAIRPTKLLDGKKAAAKLDKNASRLYQMILKRFLASQMAKQILERLSIKIIAGDYLFHVGGDREIFSGWRRLYIIKKNKESFIPDFEENEILTLLKLLPEQKFTQPPPRYSEGGLIKALEDYGIGRPSTYAPIISTILARKYVEKVDGYFHSTFVGEAVCDFLLKYFTQIVDYDFTAKMEDNLDLVAQGDKEWTKLLSQFYKPFVKKIKEVEKTAKRQEIKTEKTGKKCPKCKKGEQVIRIGRFGRFLSCSRFPDCDWKDVYTLKLKGVKCPECKGRVVVRRTRKGKKFYGCENWPKCKWATWKKPGKSQ
jgi:DNA topoisomerase I